VILGFGKEGKDTYLFLRKLFPKQIIGIADVKSIKRPDKNARINSGKNYLKTLKNYNIIHQCGSHSQYEDFDSLNKAFADISNLVRGEYYLRKFVYDNEIGEVFTKADIFLSRGGAHTTYEIKTFGKPCILVPIPWVSHDESEHKRSDISRFRSR